MVLHAMGLMSASRKGQVLAFMIGVRLLIVTVMVGIAWLIEWTSTGRLLLSAALLAGIIVAASCYEVLVSNQHRPPMWFIVVVLVLVATAVTLPQVGTAQFVGALVGAGITTMVLLVLRNWVWPNLQKKS